AVYRAMARNPADRYASAADLEADLKRASAAISDFPTQSRAWTLPRLPRRWWRGWPAVAIVALAAVAFGLYGVLGAMRRFSGQSRALEAATASAPKVVAVLPLAGAAGDPQT